MQNRTFSEICLRALIVCCCALSLSGTAFAESDISVQRLDIPVGMSPSSVQPDFREGQVMPSGREVSRGEIVQVSQGGKQGSLFVTSSIGEVTSVLIEAVTDPAHFDALEKFRKSLSVVENGTLNSSTRKRHSAKHLQAAEIHRLIAATNACTRANLWIAHSI